jgi:hypothetical protein
VFGYVIWMVGNGGRGGGNGSGANKSLGFFILYTFIYSVIGGRNLWFWLGHGCIDIQGNDRISYSCSLVIITPLSQFYNALLLPGDCSLTTEFFKIFL